jgi:hypothetical protein
MKYFLVGCAVFFGFFFITHFSILLVCATIDVKVTAGVMYVDSLASLVATCLFEIYVPKDHFE